MAKNIEINGAIPEMYQEAQRPSESFDFDELKGVGEPFGGFLTQAGDIWRFDKLEAYKTRPELRRKQRVQRELRAGEKPRYAYFILAVRNRGGVESNEWFSLSFLSRTDSDQKPVNETWYRAGGHEARLAKLCEMGAIKILDDLKIRVPVFQGGRPNRVPTLDPITKEQMVDAYGTAMTHVETREQDAHHITPVGGVVAEVADAKPVNVAAPAATDAAPAAPAAAPQA